MNETTTIMLLIFMLALFTGYEVITKIPPIMHTPLMAGTNAISGVVIAGAIVVASRGDNNLVAAVLGGLAVALATINVVGGFAVTDRMLALFHSSDSKEQRP